MWLTRTAITRPVSILMLVLALVILGWQSRSSLPVDLYPDIQFPMLYITTVYPGTGPEEMETLISKPIEDSVSTISGLKKLTSTSSEGVSNVMMEFEIGTNLDQVASDVRSKLDALRNALPQDAKAPIVNKIDVGAMPVVQLSASSERRASKDVRQMADDLIKDRLSQLPGVAAVTINGGDIREVRVEIDKARLEAYHLSINQVVSALQMENLNLPSGTIKEEQRNYAVRVMGEFENPDAIYNVRISSAANPNLTIRDVAKVSDTLQEPSMFNRMNGGPSITVVVQKQSNGNTVKVVDQVRKALTKLTGRDYSASNVGEKIKPRPGVAPVQAALPDDYQITVAFDQSTFIKDALNDVNSSLFLGALLAVLIVFLFLHSMRGTFIVGLAIPTSMIATFLVMRACGFSINMMSMMGLSLAVGVLVDDSIVVIENIHRHLRMGESAKEAALNGRTEIGLAAMTITMVDVVVFIPIAFMGGIVGQFFRQFGIVIASATLFSLLISFTLTPMLASRWLKAHADEEEEEVRQIENPSLFRRFTLAWERGYNFVDGIYRLVLAWALDHRPLVICLGVMTMMASFCSTAAKMSITDFGKAFPFILIGLLLTALVWWIGRTMVADRSFTVRNVLLSLLIVIVGIAVLVVLLVVAQKMKLQMPVKAIFVLGMAAVIWFVGRAIVPVKAFGRTLLILFAALPASGGLLFGMMKGMVPLYIGLPVMVIILVGCFAHTYVCALFLTVYMDALVVMSGLRVGKIAGGSATMLAFLTLVLMLAIVAYFTSLPTQPSAHYDKERVLKPLYIWTGILLVIMLLIPTKFTFEFQPKVDERQFSITIEHEVGTPLAVTNATTRMIEEALDPAKNPETRVVMATVGGSSGGMFGGGSSSSDTASISVELKDLDDIKGLSGFQKTMMRFGLMHSPLRRTDEVIADVNKEFGNLPGVKVTAAVSEGGPGGAPVTIEVSGADMNKVQDAANQVADAVRTTPGTFATELSWREGRPELQVHIDRNRAAQYGISVAQIASALRTSLEGDTSTKYREGGKEYDIRVMLPKDQRALVSQVPDMVVGTAPGGQPIRLSDVVNQNLAGGPTKIERTNRQRSVTVTAQLHEGNAVGNMRQLIDPKIKALNLQGVTTTWAGQAEMMDESFGNMGSALLLSIALVFMLMAALFESILSPLIIMLSVPMAMAGAIFALTITQKSLSIVSMIGIIMLVGLVTKNAILMVDYTNTLRKEHGMDRRKALLEAGPTRLRPILMTTLAMIFGMLPTAIALSKGSEFRQPMAITVIGGLILSLFLTLLMVPVFYEIMDNVAQGITRTKEKALEKVGV